MAGAPPVVLTVAGFDPSSGAGVTADIKTIAAHGCYGVACITALTIQSTVGVSRVEALDPEVVTATLRELTRDVEVAAVKIGMLGSAKVVKAVAEFLGNEKLPNVVLDPILKSSYWVVLVVAGGAQLMFVRLFTLSTYVSLSDDDATTSTDLEVST